MEYVRTLLLELLEIPSPTGYTDQIVHRVGDELRQLGIPFELTRRGAIRADLAGELRSPDRALVAHLDTLGAMVKAVKSNGRLALAPIGTWSSRFAEGARVNVFTHLGGRRGTILPLKASGHTFGDDVDDQPVGWEYVEVRLDEIVQSAEDLVALGIRVGDFVAVDPAPEYLPESGFLNSRHLDDKAGVAVVLGAAKAVLDSGRRLPIDCHLIFTISEEVGSGSSHTLHGDVAEMVTIDSATQAPGQNSTEFGVTIAAMDSAGPFDWHLNRKLIELCEEHRIRHRRDVFLHYRSDSASAVEAGNDLRTALVCFGVDASHSWERTHDGALQALGDLLVLYMLSEPTFLSDRESMTSLIEEFPTQPIDIAEPADGELPEEEAPWGDRPRPEPE
jgi:peptidase M42 family hydrolase